MHSADWSLTWVHDDYNYYYYYHYYVHDDSFTHLHCGLKTCVFHKSFPPHSVVTSPSHSLRALSHAHWISPARRFRFQFRFNFISHDILGCPTQGRNRNFLRGYFRPFFSASHFLPLFFPSLPFLLSSCSWAIPFWSPRNDPSNQ